MITNYVEIVKSIIFTVDFGYNAWEYKLEVHKNQKNLYFPVLMKNDIFDLKLTFDKEIVS